VKANAIARQTFLKSVEGSLVLTIEDSTSLFFKNKLDAAIFYLKRGIHYYNTMWHHMAELMFLKSWSIMTSDSAAQNLFHFYNTTKNTAKMMEWYYKYCLLKGSHEKMATLLKTAISGNSRILGPFLEQLVSSNPTTSGWAFFKNVYVISLENAVARRSHVASHFGSKNINFSFFDAVDGRNTHDALKKFAIHRKIVSESCAKELSPGALGCLMSHYKLWEKIYMESDSTNSWTLICEDDVKFHPSFTPETLNSYLSAIPTDAKLLKFGWFKFDSIHKERIVAYNNKWVKFLGRGVPSTICYAVHTSILPVLLAKTYEHAIDDFDIDGSYGCTDLCLDPSFYYCDTYKTTFKGVCADCKDPSQINS
jgi:glycosyl transferase family 25